MKKSYTILISLTISLVALAVSLFPHWYAWKHVSPGYVFTGQASWFDPWDINVYVAAVNWGQQHGFLMENMYTSQPNPKIVYYPLYTLAGMIAPTVNPFLVFYGFSVFSTFFLVSVLVMIVQKLIKGFFAVLLVVASIVFGGGFGFLVFPSLDSLDVTMTAVTFHSAIQRPHEAIALGSYILALSAFYFSITTTAKRWRFIAPIFLMLAMILYPYYLLSFFSLTGLFTIWRFGWKWFLNNSSYVASLGLVGFGIAAFEYLNLHSNVSFSAVVGQHLSRPTTIPFLLGYGLLTIPFIFQLVKMRPISSERMFFSIWVIVSVTYALLPLGIARFYLRGMFVPLVLLTVLVIKHLLQKHFFDNLEKKLLIALVYLFISLSPTTISVFLGRIHEIDKHNQWYYLTKDQSDALLYIDSTFPKQSVILSEYYLGNLIPAYTDHRVYFGHLIQTPDAESKQRELAQFYAGKLNQTEAEQFLTRNNIEYVYWGLEEAAHGAANNNGSLPYQFLTEVYKNPTVSLYQIQN